MTRDKAIERINEILQCDDNFDKALDLSAEYDIEMIEIWSEDGEEIIGMQVEDEVIFYDCEYNRATGRYIDTKTNTKTEEVKENKKMTVKELRAEAKARGIKGYSKMKKEDLENAIYKLAEEQNAPETVTINLFAFTGMYIGTYTAEKYNDSYGITTKDGKHLTFNLDGSQMNAKNSRYANKIEIA